MTATQNALEGARLWKATLGELELQMTTATFNTWLKGTEVVEEAPGKLVVGLVNDYAVDWVSNRLDDTIKRTLRALAERNVEISYIVRENGRTKRRPRENEEPSPPASESDEVSPDLDETQSPTQTKEFAGFDTPLANWTSTPDTFFTVVAKERDGSITKVVAQVIYHTWGQFEDKQRQHRVWEWPVSMTSLAAACGISRTSLYVALWDCRAKGYIIARPLEDEEADALRQKVGHKPTVALRLRQGGEPVDFPDEERPGYGSKTIKKTPQQAAK